MSGGQARHGAPAFGSIQATRPGDHATGQERQHGNDDGRVSSVYAGLAQLLRILRNARSASESDPFGPAAATGRSVAAVENTAPSSSCLAGAGDFPAARAPHCGQRSWPLVFGSVPSPRKGALQCLFSVARTSVIDRGALAQPTRIAVYGPVCTVVWQGAGGDRRPYADQCPLKGPEMHDLIAVEKIAQWKKLKTLVLDSVSSPITKRVYNMALDGFYTWFQQASQLG